MRQHSSFVMCCYYHIHAVDSDRRVVWYERENAGSGMVVQLSDHYFSFDRSDNYRNPHFQEEKVVLMHIGHRSAAAWLLS